MTFKLFNLGSKLPYFNRAYVILLQHELQPLLYLLVLDWQNLHFDFELMLTEFFLHWPLQWVAEFADLQVPRVESIPLRIATMMSKIKYEMK